MSPWRRKLYRRIHRLLHRRNMRHMEKVWPHLKMQPMPGGINRVTWRGSHLFDTLPWSDIKTWSKTYSRTLIITTGQSIKDEDLTDLSDTFVIGVNGAVALQDTHDIKFDAYFIIDSSFVEKRFSLFKRVIDQRIPCFLAFNCVGQACDMAPQLLKDAKVYVVELANKRFNTASLPPPDFYHWAKAQNSIRVCDQFSQTNDRVGFSLDPAAGFFDGATVAFWAVQTALYARFSAVGILGMDLGTSTSVFRFYEDENDTLRSKLEKNFSQTIEPSFRLASRIYDEHKIGLYNLSLISRLSGDIIPKMRLADFMRLTSEQQRRSLSGLQSQQPLPVIASNA